MNWEKSKASTPLKRDFIKAFFGRNQSFFLTGGSALGIFYLEHCLSHGLDFCTTEKVNWHLLEITMAAVCEEIHADHETLNASPGFYRFQVTRLPDGELVDLVVERVLQIDEQKSRTGDVRVDTLKKIFINKICMLVSRCEVKDPVDLYYFEKEDFEVDRYIPEARKKDAGFDPAMASSLLSKTRIQEVPHYLIKPLKVEELESFVRKLQKKLAEISFPEE